MDLKILGDFKKLNTKILLNHYKVKKANFETSNNKRLKPKFIVKR